MAIVGIDKNWKTDLLYGVLFAVGIIVISSLGIIGTIGIPSVSASVAGDIGRALIVIVCAAIFESFIFQEFLLDFLDEKIINLPFILAALLASIAFSLFHFIAYSGSLSAMGGSFFSAGLISFSWCYLRKWTKSILPVIICHAILNAWILHSLVVIV